jgi:hypothetical protein
MSSSMGTKTATGRTQSKETQRAQSPIAIGVRDQHRNVVKLLYFQLVLRFSGGGTPSAATAGELATPILSYCYRFSYG